jgi:hypothetical protein
LSYFAQTAPAQDQAELAEKRRLGEAIKQVSVLASIQVTALEGWHLHRGYRTAQQFIDQFVEARRKQNELLKGILGIQPEVIAIEKRNG